MIQSTYFVDDLHGWVVATTVATPHGDTDSLLFKSADGGRTWAKEAVVAHDQPVGGLQFADSLHGWAFAGGLITTADGGVTWRLATLPDGTHGDGYLQEIGPSSGWIAGGNATTLYATTDDSTWRASAPLPGGQRVVAIDFLDLTRGWVLGWAGGTGPTNPVVDATSDGGATWQQLSTATPHDNNLCFSDVNNGWRMGGTASTPNTGSTNRQVNGLQGEAAHTTDGGQSWSTVTMPAGLGIFQCLAAPTPEVAWVFGIDSNQDGFILWTGDGGQTWRVRAMPAQGGAWYIARQARSDGHIWGTGFDGAEPSVAASADGGQSWTTARPAG